MHILMVSILTPDACGMLCTYMCRESEGLSRVEASRLRIARSKLKKDFNRVEIIAQNLKSEARRCMDETDRSGHLYIVTITEHVYIIIYV